MQTVTRLITLFTPSHYALSLDLDRPGRNFTGSVDVTGVAHKDGELRLHAKGLAIQSALVNGHKASFQPDENDELVISSDVVLADQKQVVTIKFSGEITDAMHGLYPCYFEVNGEKKELLATQFESHHAREVFPCVDEPEAKSTFDVTLTTERGVTVLSNMPVKDQTEENGRLVTRFDTTPTMSSYLLAWVIGDLQKKTAVTKRGVEVNVWATTAQPAASLDFALEAAVDTIDFFETYFGIDYPLPKCDHVALPDFTSGAMENWGLITYREIALLADPATTSVSTKRYVATVIAHELSHQWFGNLVTMKWWNNLWLNESFANLMEYIAVDALHPDWDIWLDFSAQESLMATRRDAIDGVQSVQIDVNHPDEITSIFDGAIVYAKGARLMRMLFHHIGEKAFKAGLHAYFTAHSYKNTDENDLWAALSAASGQNVAELMTPWISRPGYPVVHVMPDGLKQERFFIGPHAKSAMIWPIPLGAESSEDVPALLETAELRLPIADDERFNLGDAAHFITHYQPDHLHRILDEFDKLQPIDRLQLLHEQTLLARAGVISSAELISMLDYYKDETNENVWDIVAVAFAELKKFVEGHDDSELKLKAFSAHLARAQYERLGWEIKNGEPESDSKLRATILGMMAYSEEPDIIKKAVAMFSETPLERLDAEIRPVILTCAVRSDGGAAISDALFERYPRELSSELQNDICGGLTSTKDPAVVKKMLSSLTDSAAVRSQDVFRWFAYLIRNRYGRDLAWQWLTDNWPWIEKTYGGDKSYDDFPRYAAGGLVTREQLQNYKDFFTPLAKQPALERVIGMGITEIEGRLETLERDGQAVRDRLAEL